MIKEIIKLLVSALIALVTIVAFMLLWNLCLVGAVDGVHEIVWWQSWGILILAKFFIKNPIVGVLERFVKEIKDEQRA